MHKQEKMFQEEISRSCVHSRFTLESRQHDKRIGNITSVPIAGFHNIESNKLDSNLTMKKLLSEFKNLH